MRVVFLDIDGVLNDYSWDPMAWSAQIHGDKVRRLNRLLFRSGAHLVLSSAWRYIVHRGECNLNGMDWLLRSHGLHAGRLVGCTQLDTLVPTSYGGRHQAWPMENERGVQIQDWIDEHPVRDYVVIDDLDLGITDMIHPFVHVDGKVGLTDRDVDRAAEILKGWP